MSKSDFHAFLLIYASYIDFEFTEEEQRIILKTVPRNQFDHIHDIYLKMTASARLETIIEQRKKLYSGSLGKAKLMTILHDQFNVDDDFSKLEKTTFNFLDRMIE